MAMPKFTRPTYPSIELVPQIAEIKKEGFDFLEIFIEGPKCDAETLLENSGEIKKAIEESGMHAISTRISDPR